MLTYSTPNCLANTRSSAVKSPGICREILMPGESGSRGRPPPKTGPAPRLAAPTARTKSRRFKVQLLVPMATTSVRRCIESMDDGAESGTVRGRAAHVFMAVTVEAPGQFGETRQSLL